MKSVLIKLKKLVLLLFGFVLLVIYLIRGGSGLRRFYINAQIKNGLERTFLEHFSLSFLFNNYALFKSEKDSSRISDIAIEQYTKDESYGYNSKEYLKGGKTLEEQQRGLILPLLEKKLSDVNIKKVCEIGTGNGDIIGWLGKKYKDKEFEGIDFFIRAANENNKFENTNFIRGYALDILIDNPVKYNLLYFCSTLIIFTPKELEAYLNACFNNGIENILINEPCWAGVKPDKRMNSYSVHLEGAAWFHNYPSYLIDAGYIIDSYEFFRYKHPKSTRKDIYINLASAKIKSS
jgi:hypothetical protein